MDPLKLRIRNVAGISKVDLTLRDIVMVAGSNAAGKSSLIQAVAAAAAGSAMMRGVRTKRGAVELVHNADEAGGSIWLDYGLGSVRITYPDAVVERAGQPMDLGTPLAIGAARFMGLAADDRLSEIINRFRAEPIRSDLDAWLEERGPKMDEAQRASLWGRIEDSGWDAVLKNTKEAATKRKGAWEQTTGKKWGDKAHALWCPTGLLADEDYDHAEALAAAAEAKADLDDLTVKTQVSAGQRAALEEEVERTEDRQAVIAKLDEEAKEHSEQLERLTTVLQRHDELEDTSALPLCPHCAQRVRVTGARGAYELLKAPPSATPERIARAKAKRAVLQADVDACSAQIKANTQARTRAQADLLSSERARADLLKLASVPIIPQEQVDKAREKYIALEAKAASIAKLHQARKIAADWKLYSATIDALEPAGVRSQVLRARIANVNKLLGEMGAVAKWGEVRLTDDLEVLYDGRPYALLAESEQWRCDLIIGATLCHQEGAKLYLIDRLDVLAPQLRPGVLFLAKHLRVPVVVAMTSKEPSAVPDIASHKLGQAYWIAKGTIAGLISKGGIVKEAA